MLDTSLHLHAVLTCFAFAVQHEAASELPCVLLL